VLIMLNGDLVGGVEVWALTYGKYGRCATDYRPIFISLKEGGFYTRARELGLDVHLLPTRHALDFALARRVADFVREHAINLIHTHTVRANFVGRLAGRATGIPVVTHIHSRTLEETANRVKNWINWRYDLLTERLTDHFIFVSPTLQRDYSPRLRTSVIPNGVEPPSTTPRRDLRSELGISADAPTFGCIAVLRARKGVEDLIAAAARVMQQIPNAHCLVVGSEAEPGYIDALKAQTARLGIAANIHFTGYRTDVPDVLETLDILCLPSIFGEGLPLIVLEALFARRPVVATRVEGTALAVLDGETGFLIEPRDVAAMAERITRLLSDAQLRHQFGQRGRADAEERFTPERMIRDLHAVYDQVLARHAR
jgi:glycosyltransferase involved in cell wall biosynthesis